MKLKSLRDLLIEEMRDLHSAESQLTKALPKMAKSASNEELSDAFQEHLEQTKGHLERLDQAFEMLEASPGRKKCQAMAGLIAEGSEMMKEDAEDMVHDAAIIAAAQRIEHYEIAGYGCARTFAKILGEDDIADLLQQTLDEEEATDQKLTSIAMSGINEEAAQLAETE
jgi:ferritin-like metal-binding protein YciE